MIFYLKIQSKELLSSFRFSFYCLAIYVNTIILVTVISETCLSSICYGQLLLLAPRLLNLANRSCHFGSVAFLEAHNSFIPLEVLASVLVHADHFVHLCVQFLILSLDCLGVLIQVHYSLLQNHLRHHAIILQLHLLQVNPTIHRVDRGLQGGFSIFKVAYFAHRSCILFLCLIYTLFCPVQIGSFEVKGGFSIMHVLLRRL